MRVKYLIVEYRGLQDGSRDADITKADLYSRFSITGKEISAFVVDRDFDWSEIASLSSGSLRSGDASQETEIGKSRSVGVILPVLDPCGMTLVLDQVLLNMPLSAWTAFTYSYLCPSLPVHRTQDVVH